MITIYCLDLKTKEIFAKTFESPYLCKKFVNKCKYSKRIKIIQYPNSIYN